MILDNFNGKKVLILGYGTEGKVTEAFIRLRYPDISIIITDQNRDENYLQNQNDYDFIIKTPPVTGLILKAAGVEKGSGKNATTKVGKITRAQALEIANKKMSDLNAKNDEGAINIVAGSARSMGIEVKD
ncbi:hypothetical protein COU48_01260, partial [Candidatus Nomurabacteria bacterium CG10_big_fil_rev_8_21_14_0_10_03_31_7]